MSDKKAVKRAHREKEKNFPRETKRRTTFKTSSSAFDFPKGSIDGIPIQRSLRSIPLAFRLRDFISENPRDRIEVGLSNKQQMGLSSRDRIGKERVNKKKGKSK
ncbi:hypothetical protein V1478_007112 [Vespula squamosa]|uniref:Uncharacterized protein n=1 Tax=Vespula squamosa TaxID=30214 RepID=A0ABD2B295_VESSQ